MYVKSGTGGGQRRVHVCVHVCVLCVCVCVCVWGHTHMYVCVCVIYINGWGQAQFDSAHQGLSSACLPVICHIQLHLSI